MLTLLLAFFLASQPATPQEDRVREFVQAFNERKIDAMLAAATETIQWVSIDRASMSIETEGREALRASMTKYFAACATCKSELLWIRTAGSRVVALERASWTARTGPMSQSSLSVYELTDGLIARVYYFPAERDAAAK